MNEELKEKIINAVEDDIMRGIDGFYTLWLDDGSVDSYALRIIADHLDELNKEWEENINNYFEKERKIENK